MAERVFLLLLRLFPSDFRERFGADMQEVFRLRLARAEMTGSRMGIAGFLGREVLDMSRAAWRERRSGVADGERLERRSSSIPFGRMLPMLLRDVRYAIRTLWSSPGFSLVVVLTLALGIGANTAIFSVVNAVLLEPLPYPDPDRLTMVWERNYPRGVERNVVNLANFLDWKEQSTSFEDMAAFYRGSGNLTGDGEPERVVVTYTHPRFFSVLGTPPWRGRVWNDSDGEPGAAPSAALSHAFWLRRFGADPDVIGRSVLIDGTSVTVVGIMPSHLDFPQGTEMWVPWTVGEQWRVRSGRFASVVARLRPDVTFQQAQVEMDGLGRRLEDAYPDFNGGWGISVVRLQDQIAGDVGPALLVMLGAVGVVLLIACANVANLLLGRASARSKELAIRAALGAGRSRIVQQLLTEAGVLTAVSALVGLTAAVGAIEALVALSPGNIPRLEELTVDARLIAFSVGVTAFTGIAFGVLPAFHAARADLQSTLRSGGRTASGAGMGRGRHRWRSALVVAEISLALVLLIGAGLLTRSFTRLLNVDLGFQPEGVLSARVQLSSSAYPEDAQQLTFFRELTSRLSERPGIVSASAISFLPLGGRGAGTSFHANDRPVPPQAERPVADVRAVQPLYFRTMGIAVQRGRTFDGTERPGAEVRPVVINEEMVRRLWPGEDPIGKRITMPWDGDLIGEVIGVVADVRHQGLETPVRSTVYWSHAQFPYSFMAIVVRAERDPRGLAGVVREEIWALDPEVPVSDIRTMEDRFGASVAQRRFNLLLLSTFAAVAVLVAAVGIYGVMSFAVTQRSHEMGLRIALGAKPAAVMRRILGQGLLLTAGAVGLGLLIALAVTRTIESLLFSVSATDPLTFAAVAVGLVAVAMVACLIPARRATRADPMMVLRSD